MSKENLGLGVADFGFTVSVEQIRNPKFEIRNQTP